METSLLVERIQMKTNNSYCFALLVSKDTEDDDDDSAGESSETWLWDWIVGQFSRKASGT